MRAEMGNRGAVRRLAPSNAFLRPSRLQHATRGLADSAAPSGDVREPDLTVALASPTVRTTKAIRPFCRAKTCSTAARIFDRTLLARATFLAIDRPAGFLRWICERNPLSARCCSFAFER